MRVVLAACLLLSLPMSGRAAAGPTPTVIVDIHALGFDAVASLKHADGVLWSAEFGNELLVGVDPVALPTWRSRKNVRAGPVLDFDEVLVSDHKRTLDVHEPALAVVGGYEILRRSDRPASAADGPQTSGRPLPVDGVFAREIANEARRKGVALPARDIENLIGRIDRDRWFDTMSALAAFNRNSFNPTLGLAHDWILQRFVDAGLEAQSFGFTMTASSAICMPPPAAVQAANPIGYKRGQTLPDEWIIVGAHYDSRNAVLCETSANPSPQPGANDNASGCAGVIELARVFAPMATQRSVLFMCFAGEEQRSVGSNRYVTSLLNDGLLPRVKHMINLDMIGHAVDDTLTARVETTPSHAAVLAAYADAAGTYAPELNLITTTQAINNSDHYPFLHIGVPGAFTWENGSGIYPHYHLSSDVPGNMLRARPLAHGILKMDAARLAGLAGLLPLFSDGFGD